MNNTNVFDTNLAPSGPPIRCCYSRLAEPAALLPNPRNPNKHPEEQLELYARVIEHQGWRRAVVVSRQSGLIVTGHGAVEVAKRNGWQVPVDDQDFDSPEDETAHMLADNRLPELAELSAADAGALLVGLKVKGFDLDLTGFAGEDLAALLADAAPQDQPAPDSEPEASNYQSQYGVIVSCKDEADQTRIYDELMAKGYPCKVVVT